MLTGIAILLLFQLIGEITGYFAGGLIPGPVLGMAMIAAVLTLSMRNGNARIAEWREASVGVSNALLTNLGILFVPAGVGIIQHVDIVRERGAALLVTIVVSTALTLAVTVWVFIAVKKLSGGRSDD